MKLIDFFIGLTLVNGLLHFLLGLYKRRMLSAFGFGNLQNILYGLLNFAICMTLFLYEYGIEGLKTNGIFVGAAVVVVLFFVGGKLWYRLFQKKIDTKFTHQKSENPIFDE